MSDEKRQQHVHTIIEAIDGVVLAHKTGLDPDGAARVRREAEVLSQLRHPNVVELIDVVDSGDEVALWTSFAGRSTLSEATASDAAGVARLAGALVTCLVELHAMGWSHGHLTADHVVIGAHDRLSLCSLASAQHANGTPSSTTAVRADLLAASTVLDGLLERLAPSHRRSELQRRHVVETALANLRSTGTRAAAMRCIETLAAIGGPVPPSHQVPPRPQLAAPSPRHAPGILKVVALALLLVAAAFALWHLGGPLHAPWHVAPVRTAAFGDLPAPVGLAIDLARIVALVACAYGATLCAATAAMSIRHRDELDDLLARVAPPVARKLVTGAIGVGLLSGIATRPSSRPGPASPEGPGVAVAVLSPSTNEPATTLPRHGPNNDRAASADNDRTVARTSRPRAAARTRDAPNLDPRARRPPVASRQRHPRSTSGTPSQHRRGRPLLANGRRTQPRPPRRSDQPRPRVRRPGHRATAVGLNETGRRQSRTPPTPCLSPSSSSLRSAWSSPTPRIAAMARMSSRRIVRILPLKSWRCTWIIRT